MLPLLQSIREDVACVFDRDPAARSYFEVLLCYPGLHAVWAHHISQWLWQHDLRFLARFNSQVFRFFTGIEIHPAAEIGRRFFIDHGMGVVIGETAIVGDDVTLYQGVTLGGTGKEQGKRHPTIGANVVIGTGARVLGNIRVGENCRIGANSVVLRSVPDNSTVVGVPGHIVLRNGKRVVITDPKEISDPLSDVIVKLVAEVHEIREKLCEETHATLPPEPDLSIDQEWDSVTDGAGI
jgi:serine O-acetyltransferase